MEKHILIGIRYSIIQLGGKSWTASQATPQQYISSILNEDRLNVRERTFESITVRSLADLEYVSNTVSVTILIMISDLLPESRREVLKKLANRLSPRINVLIKSIAADSQDEQQEADFKNIHQAMKSTMQSIVKKAHPCLICTVRLDDDDGLSKNFINKLASHMTAGTTGYACSFPHGFEGYYDHINDRISQLKHSYFPKNAVGLAYFNATDVNGDFIESKKVHIYNLGNHTKIDEHTPTLMDASEPMYFKSMTKTNDNGGSIHHRYLPSVTGMSSLSFIPLAAEKIDNCPELAATENLVDLEISKSGGALLALTKLLNERIQLREKQLREANSKKNGN